MHTQRRVNREDNKSQDDDFNYMIKAPPHSHTCEKGTVIQSHTYGYDPDFLDSPLPRDAPAQTQFNFFSFPHWNWQNDRRKL